MSLKRTFELAVGNSGQLNLNDEVSDAEPPTKRRITVIPHTPRFRRSSLSSTVTPFTGTPYPSRPLDSPTNPVGRQRTQNLTHSLPAVTSFSKHLPLRFQFVRPGVSPRMGGIYRVVQVPLSYTFVHLRCLIAFIFGGGFGDEREDRHLFEVKKKLSMYSPMYKPGQIRQGFTAVKLSTARDPCRYKPEIDEDSLFDDDVLRDDGVELPRVVSDSEESGDEDPTWKWELEEEYTLGHVWPRGGDLMSGIIYHYNESTAVHITLNTTTSLPRRQGHSNAPYVFIARGRVYIHPNSFLPLPKPIFSVPIRKLAMPTFRKSGWSTSSNYEDEDNVEDEAEVEEDDNDAEDDKDEVNAEDDESEDLDDADGDSDPEVGDARSCGFLDEERQQKVTDESVPTDEEESDEEEDDTEDPDVFLGVKKFNAPHAFATYLRFVHQNSQRCQYPVSDESDFDDDELLHSRSTPALVHSSSSPASSSPIRTSSVAFSSSPSFIASPTRRKSFLCDPYTASMSTLAALSTTAYTPAPAHAAWQRRRIERVQKRMEKYKKKAWMCSKDEEVEDTVDQLVGDENAKPVIPNWRSKLKKRLEMNQAKPKPKPIENGDFCDEFEV